MAHYFLEVLITSLSQVRDDSLGISTEGSSVP